jgi:hypothetical protein
MGSLHRYKKRDNQSVIAVQLNLDTDGFIYKKWGGDQCCKRGDWIVNNNGDIYTIDKDVFARTYKNLSPGLFIKTTQVWAYVADEPGTVETKEGTSEYKKGDYIVYNNPDGSDGYCMSAEKFESMYLSDDS